MQLKVFDDSTSPEVRWELMSRAMHKAYTGLFVDCLLMEAPATHWLLLPEPELKETLHLIHVRLFSYSFPGYWALSKLFGRVPPEPTTFGVRRILGVLVPISDAYWRRLNEAKLAQERESEREQADVAEMETDVEEEPDSYDTDDEASTVAA